MQKHTKVYFDFFGYDEADSFIPRDRDWETASANTGCVAPLAP